MDERIKSEADRRTEEALQAQGARDPRDFYRKALRGLKETNPDGYEKAVHHVQDMLMPGIASGEVEPLLGWREYGRLIAQVAADGRTVAIDRTGRQEPYRPDCSMDRLVLHLPDAKGAKAILVSLPPNLSSAQRATHDLLVQGKHRLAGAG